MREMMTELSDSFSIATSIRCATGGEYRYSTGYVRIRSHARFAMSAHPSRVPAPAAGSTAHASHHAKTLS